MTSPNPSLPASPDDAAGEADVHRSNQAFCAWMRGHLARAAAQWGVTATGEGVWGRRLRSLGVPARDREGRACWLRVGTEWISDVQDPVVGACWTGIPDSAAVVGVARPQVLASVEWVELDQGRMVRADLTSLLPGKACSSGHVLRAPLELSDAWWSELRASIDRVAATPTDRYADRGRPDRDPPGHVSHVRGQFGDKVADATTPTRWTTAHGDLHWANLLSPQFGLLDWEMWGRAPVGTDAATLYTFSLLVPSVAERVRKTFEDVLDGDDGRCARLRAAARILWWAEQVDQDDQDGYRDLVPAVCDDIRPIVDAIETDGW